MKKESQFPLSKEQKEEIRETLKHYFVDELEMDLGDLQVDIFMQFLSDRVGKHYYNLGVVDAMAGIKEKAADLVLLIKE